VSDSYSPPLQVMGFIATRMGDAERGPLVRMRSDDAAKRLLADGEVAWVYGPRRQELATVVIDDQVPRGGVIVRDIAGIAPSEIVRVVKVDLDSAGRRRNLV
jgi:anaerobic selenocysteine-containing dehydrogenase